MDILLEEKKPLEDKPEELQALYDTAFGSDTELYPLLKTLLLTSLDEMEASNLLDTQIMSSADTPFEELSGL